MLNAFSVLKFIGNGRRSKLDASFGEHLEISTPLSIFVVFFIFFKIFGEKTKNYGFSKIFTFAKKIKHEKTLICLLIIV